MSSSDQPTANRAPAGDTDRRDILASALAIGIGTVIALIPVGIGIYSFFDPFRKNRPMPTGGQGSNGPEGYIRVASLAALPVGGSPKRFAVVADARDSWNYLPGQPIGAVFLERTGESEVRCLHATCPHAGCSVSYRDDAFHCPCHNSSFRRDGERLNQPGKENPSPRPLDSLPVHNDELNAGEIWVKFENFYTGIEKKTVKQ